MWQSGCGGFGFYHLGASQPVDGQRRSERRLFVVDAIKSTADECCVSRPSAADGAAYVTAGELDRTAEAKPTAFCRLLSDGNNRKTPRVAVGSICTGGAYRPMHQADWQSPKAALTASDKMQTQEEGHGCRKLPESNDFPGAQRHLQLDVTGNRRLGYSSVTLAAQQPRSTLIQYADDLHGPAEEMLVG